MSTTREATINPDGTTYVPPTTEEENINNNNETENNTTFTTTQEEITTKPTDPAIYLGIVVLIIGLISFLIYKRRKKK